ncbi:hypothetical protein NDU88_005236 [Pleurodeles waltl]|uniref:Uncharacterized protein n=1 Tax=Pleurodeles waltl TaxID=8319 RepID=A0AAV7PN28_PLEWA|nr:hypothetical protein NDU88_005236 [Pleurodeles waltl]
MKQRAAAEEVRMARVQRGTLLGSPCYGKGTEAASGGPWALGGLRPDWQRCSEAGEAGAALDRRVAGPRMKHLARAGHCREELAARPPCWEGAV